MAKKMTAAIVAITLLFVCVFAACNKNGTYTDPNTGNVHILVTDEEGNKQFDENGDLLVYATDSDGNLVTNNDGEPETLIQAFVGQFEDGGAVEAFSYKITLPDGWKTVKDTFDAYENKSKGVTADLTIVKYFYGDYYYRNLEVYEQLVGVEGATVTWEDDITIFDGAEKATRFSLLTEEGASVLYFFENSGNVYKLLFESDSASDTIIADTEEFCKAMTLKPYQYYSDVTAVSTTESDRNQLREQS